MGKTSDRVPNERLGTSRLSHFFLKIYQYDPTSKLIGSDLTFMQSKKKPVRQIFCKVRECEIKNSSKSVLQIF